ncbi:aldo/keto reductase [Pararhizobium haloflavum]|uniref:aldo/keto reductase n=1 Tax=Pararhizobium haloflavum TaxID=2037914 RepID=UPI000C19119B|nr:aldo/keto reductase [Pararhizobium haloflavum]
MKYRKLGRTGLEVSALCLGTMTWGTQNTQAEAHEQMDYAVGKGINFFDTAEMYPTNPTSAETQGATEEIVGNWFRETGKRSDIVLATKATGPGPKWIRDGAKLGREDIVAAVDGSLKRLGTDHIDLYQIHWPNRDSYHFRQSWSYDPSTQDRDEVVTEIHDILRGLDDAVKAGKVRHVGLSNETCWGTSQYLAIAEREGLPRVQSVQNEYSLMQRLFDLDMAELAHNEDVGLLAFSPLAAGLLSGKYQGDVTPPGTRREAKADLGGRLTPLSLGVVDEYLAVARKHQLDPCQMALAFCLTRPFMTAAIIGATSMSQLRTDIAAIDLTLDQSVLDDIQAVYRRFPVPM